MSENIPESVPTSADPRSHRPIKKSRSNNPFSGQQEAVEALFEKHWDREIQIPHTKEPRTAGSMAPPPELVPNVQGSSAGAGSGEFHVYKASRRREYERMRLMDEESRREESDKLWSENMEANKIRDEEKTKKNARRRKKKKEAAEAKKAAGKEGVTPQSAETKDGMENERVTVGNSPSFVGTEATSNGKVASMQPSTPEPQGITIHDED